jgi:hypothetical protein
MKIKVAPCIYIIMIFTSFSYARAEDSASKTLPLFGSPGMPNVIAGDLPGIVFTGKAPYVVTGDIFVPRGKTVAIEAGAVFLFKNFTTLQVLGKLRVNGKSDKPVVFTSVHDTIYNSESDLPPAPFDWNGIYLHEEASGSALKHCVITYSVEGVTAQTKFFTLDSVIFRDNGRASLTIEGEIYEIEEGPYEYTVASKSPQLIELSTGFLSDRISRRRAALRYASVAFAAGGAVLSVLYAQRYNASSRQFDDLSSVHWRNLNAHSSADWESAREQQKMDFVWTMTGALCIAAGAAGFSWSFTF